MNKAQAPIVIEAKSEKYQHQEAIAQELRDLAKAKAEVSRLSEAAQNEVENMPQYQELVKAGQAVEAASEKLRIAKLGNRDLNNLLDTLAEARKEVRAINDALSSLLIHYATTHKQRSLNVLDEHREIDITAKIGKRLEQQEVLPL